MTELRYRSIVDPAASLDVVNEEHPLPVQLVALPPTWRVHVGASATGGASVLAPALPAAVGMLTWCEGFIVTGLGATSAVVIAVTLDGLRNTLTFYLAVPAGATGAITAPLSVQFASPVPAVGPNQAITLTVPSFGSGNTSASAAIWGYQEMAP
jgi:hypothetical protein